MVTNPDALQVDIIIPTMDNQDMLYNCVQSILLYSVAHPIRIIIVNNGDTPVDFEHENVMVLNPDKNLGWEGGLIEGLKHSNSKYVVFANDDIFIPRASYKWIANMHREMELFSNVGAIGPSSNTVMGKQNMLCFDAANRIVPTSYLIGFCVMLKREALDKAGGVQHVQFGGDDIDLSIRLRKAGYKLSIMSDVFVYHYGFQTGERIHGGPDKPGGWNSRDMTEKTNMELIRKHGFLEYWKTIKNDEFNEFMSQIHEYTVNPELDKESEIVRGFVNGHENVLELGCGGRKTLDHAIGVDITPKGESNYFIPEASVADVVADVSKPLPFDDGSQDCVIARHVLEHCIDPIDAVGNWKKVLKPQGRLIISCPDERAQDGIPLNPEHKHAFTPSSVVNLGKVLGMDEVGRESMYNGTSFTVCLERGTA
jgi:SAM-dependent methyltransferase